MIEQIRTRFRTKIQKYFSTCEIPQNLHRNLWQPVSASSPHARTYPHAPRRPLTFYPRGARRKIGRNDRRKYSHAGNVVRGKGNYRKFRGPQYFPSHGKTIPLIRWATRFLTIQLPETMWQVILSALVAGQALPFVPKVCRSKYGRHVQLYTTN